MSEVEEKIKIEERIRLFDETFIDISKTLRKLERNDQIKMITLLMDRFSYNEHLEFEKLKTISWVFPQAFKA